MSKKTREQAFLPIYPHDRKYAMEHGEVKQSVASYKENIACREAIEKAISEGFDGMSLSGGAAKDVLAEFGAERVSCVLAATIQNKSWDGRFSRNNKEWAAAIQVHDAEGDRFPYVVQSHPGVLNVFINCAREEMQAAQERETALAARRDEKKPSIRAQLAKKPEQEPKPDLDARIAEQTKKMGEAVL